ncbi:FadR/GntR family transcriptional regulator [Agrococcus jejuensis]|uniref:DNA-binding transcriptional regulator, FadR family n=1 Tax=Agrococcus jejuensis TaxID=399736 RepID=A0A1G8EW56_9MICO|nr:FCD domain-containing protein [Agrococcus jejuensis]SDH74156.1 DNA-binding transcriptional regulator, FadR family [Agrococcus jejuensis]
MDAGAHEPPSSLIDDALLGPVRAVNAFEETVGRLLQQIRLGIVEPGASLPPERELATRFAVSRDTVREAIRALTEAGYVHARRGRYGGTFVASQLPAPTALDGTVDVAELDDVFGVRDVLEPGAARLAAARALSAAERAALTTHARESAAASADDYRRLDSRLHLAIAELSGVPSLVTLVAENRMRVNALLDAIPQLTRNIEHSDEQHRAVVDAILAGDPAAAEEAMREHLAGSAVLLRGFLG